MPRLTAPYRPGLSIGKLMAAIALAAVGFALVVLAYRERDAWLLFVGWAYNLIGLPILLLDRVERDVPRRWQRLVIGLLCAWLMLSWFVPVSLIILGSLIGPTPIAIKKPAPVVPVSPPVNIAPTTSIIIKP